MNTKPLSLFFTTLVALSATHASAQYPEEYPQQQPQQQQPQQQQYQQQPQQYQQPQAQPAPVPVTNIQPIPLADPRPSITRSGGFRLNVDGYLGVAGSGTIFFDGEEFASGDLSPSFGFQLQGLIPIGDYVLVGPALSFRSLKGDGGGDRVSVFGVDAAFGGHYAIALGDSMAIDPYVLFALGLAVGTASDVLSTEEVEFGLGFGFRAGATLWFADALGVNFGVGYQSAHFYFDGGLVGESSHVRLQEIAFEFGLALRLGE